MTMFLEVLEFPPAVKGEQLLEAIRAGRGTELHPDQLAVVPGSPFAYWLSENVRNIYSGLPPFQAENRVALQGLATTDDFRFIRVWWEVSTRSIGPNRWAQFARSGGASAKYYGASPMVIDWKEHGASLKALVIQRYGNVGKRVYNEDRYFSAGFCWPLRGRRLAVKAVGPDSVFGIASKMAFVNSDERCAYLAILNSSTFDSLLRVQAGSVAGVQYEAGLVAKTPVPKVGVVDREVLASLARRAWSLKRSLDTSNETSHAFVAPKSFNGMSADWNSRVVEEELIAVQSEIDRRVFDLYGFELGDCDGIERSYAPVACAPVNDVEKLADAIDERTTEAEEIDPSDAHISWLVGITFGRFDERISTGNRAIPPEPDPFDPLPSASPAMWPEADVRETPRPDIIVDDKGHDCDIVGHIEAWAQRTSVGLALGLRQWLAKVFFPLHVQMYSKSGRKAPIYWQLATPSASYSVWLYIHAFTRDTLFRVQNDYVAPKVAHEERRLESMRSEARDGGSSAQRKEIAGQEDFVAELRAFMDEVKCVAPLWSPDLDDGVIINFAPLWRLVPQHKAWQKELKATWDTLCEGEYDWAHLAMHLWPERVVPKCATDRSLAIAHGLEDVFWIEGSDGKWTARKQPTRPVEELVQERTVPAVKAALQCLLEAPQPGGSSRKRKKG